MYPWMVSLLDAASLTSSGVVLSVRYRAILGLKRCGGDEERGAGDEGIARSIRAR